MMRIARTKSLEAPAPVRHIGVDDVHLRRGREPELQSGFKQPDDDAARLMRDHKWQPMSYGTMIQLVNQVLSRGKNRSMHWTDFSTVLKNAAPPPRTVLQHRLQPERRQQSIARIAGYPISADQLEPLIRVYGGCALDNDARWFIESVFGHIQFTEGADALKRCFAETLLDAAHVRLNQTPFDETTVDKLIRIFRIGGMTAASKAAFFDLLENRSFTGAAEMHAETLRDEDLPGTHAPWTFFVRINGHGILSNAMIEDLLEMEKVGSIAGKIHVVALVTSHEEGTHDESRSGFRLLHIVRGSGTGGWYTSSRSPIADDSPLARYEKRGHVDVHDPRFLRAAIEHVKEAFPSDHLLVNLWGHGANNARDPDGDGIIGRVLHAEDWERAIEGLDVDVLASDSCSMGTYENALQAARCGVGHYLASQDDVSEHGWRYDTVLRRASRLISSDEGLSPERFSQLISEHFVELGHDYKNFASLKLDALAIVHAKLDRLAQAMLEQGGLRPGSPMRKIWDQASRSKSGFADLGELAFLITRATKQGTVYDAALELTWALEESCQHRWRTDGADSQVRSTGLVVYAPVSVPSSYYRDAKAAWSKGQWPALLATLGAVEKRTG